MGEDDLPNPNALYDDMAKLNALYEELCWDHDDKLVFTHDGERVIIYNETQEEGFRFNAKRTRT